MNNAGKKAMRLLSSGPISPVVLSTMPHYYARAACFDPATCGRLKRPSQPRCHSTSGSVSPRGEAASGALALTSVPLTAHDVLRP